MLLYAKYKNLNINLVRSTTMMGLLPLTPLSAFSRSVTDGPITSAHMLPLKPSAFMSGIQPWQVNLLWQWPMPKRAVFNRESLLEG